MAKKIMIGDQEIKIPELKIGKITLILILIVVWVALTSFYTIGPDEEGVVRRFGEWVRTEESGLHFKFPYPIEKVDKPKVTEVKEISVGTIAAEAKMLTGDENIILVLSLIHISEPTRPY